MFVFKKKLVREDQSKSGQIYLYTFVISDEGFQVPIFSMVSETHTINFINFWMNEFVRFYSVPDEFISDMSLVLLNSASKSFGLCANLTDYINRLYRAMNGSQNTEKLMCFIRIDKNHLMKNITQAPSLKCQHSVVKMFYVYCVCLLILCETLEDAEYIIKHVLIIAYSETIGKYQVQYKYIILCLFMPVYCFNPRIVLTSFN